MINAHAQLRSFFQRWQRLEEEAKAISDDKKELFAEMKGCGFDTKAARAVFRDGNKDHGDIAEKQAMYDLYWNALFSSKEPENTPVNPTGTDRATQARDAREAETHDPETGEITESAGVSESSAITTPSDPHGADKSGSPESTDEPVIAADVTGDCLREPMAAASGQTVREGDAPRKASNGEARKSAHPDTDLSIPAFLRRSDGYQKKAAVQ